MFFSLCLNPFFSQFFSALFALVICLVPFFILNPRCGGKVFRDNAVILFIIFIVCRILQHMCVQYWFELVEFLLQFIYLIYIVVYNVFCVRRVRLFSYRSIYISGSICASIFRGLGLNETSRILRSMRIYTKTITPYFMKLATELTVRSNYKPQKVTTLRISQAVVNIQYRKLTIRFSLLLFEVGSWSSSSFRLAVLKDKHKRDVILLQFTF